MISKSDFAIVLRCAELYEKELSNTNVLFVYENRKTKKYEFVEASFLPANFKHLTGIIYPFINKNKDSIDSSDGAVHFLNLALRKRLDINKCNYKTDGTTQLKLQILSTIMSIKKTARMIGDYNYTKINVMANKMCGSTIATLAFVKNKANSLYPSSALREDIRNLVTDYHTIMAIYQKNINDKFYEKYCYQSPKFQKEKMSSDLHKIFKK